MKKTRIILDNLLFVIKHIYLWKKSIFLSIGLYSVFYSISPFIWIYVPKLLIDELLGDKRANYLILIVTASLIIAAVVGFFTEYLKGNYRMKMNTVRYNFIHMLSEKTMTMEYAYTEDTDTLNDINTAMKTIQNPNSGIGLVILKLFGTPGNLIGFLGFSTILFRLSPILLLILILSVILSYMVMVKAKNYERSKKDEQSKEEREVYYITKTMSDFEYGKDIRVYDLKKVLFSKKNITDNRLKTIINGYCWNCVIEFIYI